MKRRNQPSEPYRIKSVEPIKLLNRHEREQKIIEAKYNIFKIDAADIYVDLLTDSGTGAMSNSQWAALMMGDESYAGARSFRRFEKTVQEIFGKKYVLPCHQGRVTENLMFSTILKPGQYVISNTLFDTTRANAMHKGGVPVDLPCEAMRQDEPIPFKGNMDAAKLERFISEHGAESVGIVIMTVTNNSVGGQPVSMANIREVSEICHRHGILFYYDCARFAENAYFIKRDESGYGRKSIPEIAAEMFAASDGAMMSAKKDGLANMGGFITLDDQALFERLCDLEIIIEGFPTYGGLAGRDLEVLAVGLKEVMDFDYLDYRVAQVAYLGDEIKKAGMPIVEPTGGHAIFIDAGRLLPQIPPERFPGQSLSVEFYVEGGIRSVEIGSVMFGQTDPETGKMKPAAKELVRMAIPRRVYTNSHMDYVAETASRIVGRKDSIPGYKIVKESQYLRHFTCELAVAAEDIKVSG